MLDHVCHRRSPKQILPAGWKRNTKSVRLLRASTFVQPRARSSGHPPAIRRPCRPLCSGEWRVHDFRHSIGLPFRFCSDADMTGGPDTTWRPAFLRRAGRCRLRVPAKRCHLRYGAAAGGDPVCRACSDLGKTDQGVDYDRHAKSIFTSSALDSYRLS